MTARHSLSTAYAADSPKEASSLDPKMALPPILGLSGPSREHEVAWTNDKAATLSSHSTSNRQYTLESGQMLDTEQVDEESDVVREGPASTDSHTRLLDKEEPGLSTLDAIDYFDDQHSRLSNCVLWLNNRQFWNPILLCSIITVLAILLAGVAVLNRTFKVHFSEDSDTLFRQTVVLISLDGFRPDYLNRGLTPNLNAIAKNGIQAAYMQPSFPSVTFPNHYSIVTGLYPESHGLVGNVFHDPVRNSTFSYSDPAKNADGYWWKGGEPIWATAVLQGKLSATCFWPGSEAEIRGVRPTHWRKFNWSMTSDEKIEQALEWIDLPQQERPLFISLYFAEIDSAGHTYGVYSKEVNAALQKIDHAIGELFSKLQKRRIENLINLVIVSDHGMADSSEDRVIYLGDDVDFSFSQVLADGPLLRIYPEKDIELVSQSIARASMLKGHYHSYNWFQVPPAYHYNTTRNIGEILIVPDNGWLVSTERSNRSQNYVAIPKGMHGYNNSLEDMRALFIAHGGAFKSSIDGNSTTEPFENIQVYQLLTKIMDLHPAPNNGSEKWLTEFSDKWLNK
ncbi:hypothetical protein BSLG_007939 [Batrachochytrium salamandrivorans]|nr:hypothetical protein BSLG_007939 [Batrachochytrium salamandrivorans]